eukprot:TRINITY_DN5582_c0_g2_i1.p1 TRINITY_DN5582_c0_g2~~TRINITY_DN5582_c0_g2_i1.p1  ORF type:complete len:255 (-),score=40.80 TRINITY_DN5582_c0_g2_i1:161-832(-)
MKLFIVKISAPSRACWLFCLIHHIPVEVVDFDALEDDQQSFLDLVPTRSLPVLDDDGFLLWETPSILKYLAEKFETPMFPRHHLQQARINMMLDWHGAVLNVALSKCVFSRIWREVFGFADEAVNEEWVQRGMSLLQDSLSYMETQCLRHHSYVCDEIPTLPDLVLSTALCVIDALPDSDKTRQVLEQHPGILRWLTKMKSLPGWSEAHNTFQQWCVYQQSKM